MTVVSPTNLEPIFKTANITQVYANGGKAYEICKKYLEDEILKATKNVVIKTQILNATGKEAVKLPSTSSANANFSSERLCKSG